MLFLRAAEDRGMDLPTAAFAVAKMLDGILVQQVKSPLRPPLSHFSSSFFLLSSPSLVCKSPFLDLLTVTSCLSHYKDASDSV
jgi:hypothetical protein